MLTYLFLSPDTAESRGWLGLSLFNNPPFEIRLPVGFDIRHIDNFGRVLGPIGPEDYDLVYYDPSSLVPASPEISRGESGVLQKSANVEGPWQNVDETSPLRVNPSLPAEFFRVRAG